MSLRRRLLTALALLAMTLVSRLAGAQSVTLSKTTGVEWPDGYVRDLEDISHINHRDCVDNRDVTFNIDYGGTTLDGYSIEVWLGSGCDSLTTRTSNSTTCILLDTKALGDQRLQFSVRTLVGPLDGTTDSGTGGTGGTSGTGGTDASGGMSAASGTGGTAGDTTVAGSGGSAGTGGSSGTGGTGGTTTSQADSVCDGDAAKPTPTSRTIWFMILTDGHAQPPATITQWMAKWDFHFDLIGPPPPVSVKAGIGESTLVMTWSESSDAPSDIESYQFVCDPPPNASAGTGAAGAAGAEGTGELPDSCGSSSVFTEGEPLDAATFGNYRCGSAPATSTTGETDTLSNFVAYNVGIVAQDEYRNIGAVSDVTCAIPEPVTDFYEAYRAAGGKGGGGFCSIGTERTHALTALILGGALGLFVRRRARSRRSTKDAS